MEGHLCQEIRAVISRSQNVARYGGIPLHLDAEVASHCFQKPFYYAVVFLLPELLLKRTMAVDILPNNTHSLACLLR